MRALGLDVGLSGVRAAVLDESGALLGAARRPLAPRLTAGRAEQDPRVWLEAAFQASADALDGRDVEVIGIGALGPAPILVDETLQPLTPALLFSLDRRAEAQRARLGVTHDHALPKLAWWCEEEPALWARAAWAVDATGYLVAALTGQPAMDVITRADYEVGTPVSDERVVAPGPCRVPAAAAADAIAGGLIEPIAARIGLPAGTPVITGTYDTFTDLAGIGVRGPGDAGLLLGSTLVLAVVVPAEVDCAGLAIARHAGDGFVLGGWTAAAGTTLEWAARELAPLADVAALAPGAGGLVALPYLAGERTPVWDPLARGAIVGLTLESSRVQLARAFLDAVALSARDHAERLLPLGLAPDPWRAGGGGARVTVWAQATADALGTPLEVVRHAGEAVGAAVLALRAVGSEVRLGVETVIEPDPAATARYDDLYGLYRNLYPALAATMARLSRFDEEDDDG